MRTLISPGRGWLSVNAGKTWTSLASPSLTNKADSSTQKLFKMQLRRRAMRSRPDWCVDLMMVPATASQPALLPQPPPPGLPPCRLITCHTCHAGAAAWGGVAREGEMSRSYSEPSRATRRNRLVPCDLTLCPLSRQLLIGESGTPVRLHLC